MRIAQAYENSIPLLEAIAVHGSVQLLDEAKRAYCYRRYNRFSTVTRMTVQFNWLHDIVLRHYRCDLLAWMIEHKRELIKKPVETWRNALTHYKNDDTRALGLLKMHYPIAAAQISEMLRAHHVAYVVKDPSLLRWLLEEIPGLDISTDWVTIVATKGDLSVLQLLYATGARQCTTAAFAESRRGGHLDVLAFLLDKYSDSLTLQEAMAILVDHDAAVPMVAARFAHVLQPAWRAWIGEAPADDATMVQVQQWLEVGIISDQCPASIDKAAANGNLRVVQFLHNHRVATATADTMDRAAENGHWDVVKFMHVHRKEACSSKTLEAAIEQESIQYVKYLHDQGAARYAWDTTKKVATNQWTTIVRFLHTRTNARFTPGVMDRAAEYGNLLIVKFLHQHRSEGCTTNAMDNAAANGYLSVVEFLHAHRSEGCTFSAVRMAVQHGHLPVVRFLLKHYRHFFESDDFDGSLVSAAVSEAVKKGKLDFVTFLFDHFPDRFGPELLYDLLLHGAFDVYLRLGARYPAMAETVVEPVMREASRTLALPIIRFITDVLFADTTIERNLHLSLYKRENLANRVMEESLGRWRFGMIHWIRALHASSGRYRLGADLFEIAIGKLSFAESLDDYKCLVHMCWDSTAKEVAIRAASRRGLRTIELGLREWSDAEQEQHSEPPLHPFLLDPRGGKWVVQRLFGDLNLASYQQHVGSPLSWPLQAVYERDLAMLKLLHELPRSALPPASLTQIGTASDDEFRFDGTRTAAIRVGDLGILEWLVTNCELPMEFTLLEEAVRYDQREIAEWLVANHPAVDWRAATNGIFTLSEDQFDWLDGNGAVRSKLDFRGILEHAVQADDVEPLRRVY